MGKAESYAGTLDWDYTPLFKTIQISTKRAPAMSSGKKDTPVAHLSGVESSPLILLSNQGDAGRQRRQALGLEGTDVQIWELRIHKGSHVDDTVPVNQLPDIAVGDRVTISGIDYYVRWADTPHPFSFGDILIVQVTEDFRE